MEKSWSIGCSVQAASDGLSDTTQHLRQRKRRRLIRPSFVAMRENGEEHLRWRRASERWQLALDSLAAWLEVHIVNSKNEREVLLDKLAEERRLKGALLEQVGALQRALDIIDADKTSSHENTSATRRIEVAKGAEDVSDVRKAVKATAVDAGREIVQSQNKPNSDQELLDGDDRNAVKAVAVDAGRVIDQSQNKPNSDQELVGGSPRGGRRMAGQTQQAGSEATAQGEGRG
ncbi:hypothetical protein MRX96_039529 [Rhipicephalus microplus]